ncbi:hypothetical protein ACSSVW_000978 [Pseudoalteromonas sp. MBR-15]|jgi:hypothetical protein|uniref:hypothetical protein n=1 Tax=Pseudoalteromonas sp. A41-2 TaxID=2785910 RepID=UPI0018CAE0B9|nr:hypothetical protein [Pseudoalteromonas sp. A41-2]QPL41705.1 hypothetical protein IT970_09335 [Pseudoalteromonas sp. A41-2]
MQYLVDLYNELLVATAVHEVFSIQVIIALCYTVALINSFYRAYKHKEHFSDFLSIAVVSSKYLITSLLMEKVLLFISDGGSGEFAQNIYLALAAINVLSMIVLYKLHTTFSYVFGELFFCIMKLTLLLALAHIILWFKLVVLFIQAEHAYIHYIYSFVVLYISIALAVVMLFPSLLKTKLKFLVSPSWPH